MNAKVLARSVRSFIIAIAVVPLGPVVRAEIASLTTIPQGGDVDTSFNLGSPMNGAVQALAMQPDGKLIIGGNFSSVYGAARGRVARLNTDGTTDDAFGNGVAGANSYVYAVALQPDGKVLIGGYFTTVNGVSRNHIARLNADGSLDTTFLNGLAGLTANNPLYALAVQPDGKVLIGGFFTTVNGISRNHIARLNADGSLDTTFGNGLAGTGSTVRALAMQPDGKVLLGGSFGDVNGVSRNRIARLNADGSTDTSFLNGYSGANGDVLDVAVQPDGKVLIGGYFTQVNEVGRKYVARLNFDGSLDTSFNGLTAADNGVEALAVQPDGKVLIGGFFTAINGVTRRLVARLNANGSLDATFGNGYEGASNHVAALAVQPDGKVLIGGDFQYANGMTRKWIARLNSDGAIDASFLNPEGANDTILALAVQPDGRVLIGGYFTSINGVDRNFLARLNVDGSLDSSFLSGLAGGNGAVTALALLPDGKIVIGGAFSYFNGVSRGRIARLNPDGSLDTTFGNGLAGASDVVYAIAAQPDGKVLISGAFFFVNNVYRQSTARLNKDGTFDTSFGPVSVNSSLDAIALQPDGKLLIGGSFGFNHGTYFNLRIDRINADGSHDNTFGSGLSGADSYVLALALQPDGRILIGGSFTTVNGVSRNRIARLLADGSLDATAGDGLGANNVVYALALQPDGKVLIGGRITSVNGVGRGGIARLNADLSLDTTFGNGMSGTDNPAHPPAPRIGAPVSAIAVQPDGRVLIGGDFTTVNSSARNYVARLYGSTAVAPTIDVEPSAQVTYDACCATFTVTATGTPLDYRWRKDGVDLVDGPGVSGARSATLRLIGIDAEDEGNYSVVVANIVGSDTSNDVALTVSAVPSCKVAACDPVFGCLLSDVPDGTSCNDGNACILGDTCRSGACNAGGVLNDGAYCDDGNFCTTGDVCNGGNCLGAPIECVDGDACTVDSCDPIAHCVFTLRAPSETSGVTVGKSGTDTVIAWVLATYADTSEVLRGDLAALPVGPGGTDEVCLGETSTTSVVDPFVPAAGSGAWYLIRGVNVCADNEPYGFQGLHGAHGAPRQSATCP